MEKDIEKNRIEVVDIKAANEKLTRAQDLLKVIDNQKNTITELRIENNEYKDKSMIYKLYGYKIMDE